MMALKVAPRELKDNTQPSSNNGRPLPFLSQWTSTLDGTIVSLQGFVHNRLICKNFITNGRSFFLEKRKKTTLQQGKYFYNVIFSESLEPLLLRLILLRFDHFLYMLAPLDICSKIMCLPIRPTYGFQFGMCNILNMELNLISSNI